MTSLYDRVQEAASFIRETTELAPEFAIILGTGLGGLTREIDAEAVIPFEEIPGFLPPTVEPHGEALVLGRIGSRSAAVLEGRLHFYEGYSMKEITLLHGDDPLAAQATQHQIARVAQGRALDESWHFVERNRELGLDLVGQLIKKLPV